MTVNLILANLIFVFHSLIVLFMIIAPFTNIPALLILHITLSFSLLVHWGTNSNVCSLSILEGYLRGKPRDYTFTHQLISPMYDISLTDAKYFVRYSTYILLGISIFNLIKNEEVKKAFSCYNTMVKSNDPLSKKFEMFIKCSKSLFVL